MPGLPSLSEIAQGQVLAQPVSAYQQGRQRLPRSDRQNRSDRSGYLYLGDSLSGRNR